VGSTSDADTNEGERWTKSVAVDHDLVSRKKCRQHLRAREANLRGQLDALDAQAADRGTYLKLADDLDGFLAQLRSNAAAASTEERQRVLRLLVKDVLIGPEKITIRHRIPVRERTASGGGHENTDTEGDMRQGYLLRWGRAITALPVSGDARKVVRSGRCGP
jgi:site-specific DNA recombinase